MEKEFQSLSLIDKEDKLTDITSSVKKLASNLGAETIIKDDNFDLFEGTHALEVNNAKLDPTLLQLSEVEIRFDCDIAHGKNETERIEYVTAIADRACRSIMDWLNDYQSLPTTVLSCRYVEYVSLKYQSCHGEVDKARTETGCDLYDQVLCSCIFATLSFVNFVC